MVNIKLNFEKTEGADRELKLVPTDSVLWETFGGAYGNVVNDIKLLIGEEKELDDWDVALLDRRQSRQGKKEDIEDIEKIALENLFESLAHQMTFYPAIYLAMPYLVKLLEKKKTENDFEGQISLITDMGLLVAMDIPDESYKDEVKPEGEVMDNYNLSILKLQEITKRFLEQHLEEVKKNSYYKVPFLTSVFGILNSDKKEAFIMFMSMWESCYMACGECEDYNENIEFDDAYESGEACDGITPAPSVIGQWDGKTMDNTYMWFSNLLSMAEAYREANLMSYYYGVYECRECGNKKQVMEFAKNYYFGE